MDPRRRNSNFFSSSTTTTTTTTTTPLPNNNSPVDINNSNNNNNNNNTNNSNNTLSKEEWLSFLRYEAVRNIDIVLESLQLSSLVPIVKIDIFLQSVHLFDDILYYGVDVKWERENMLQYGIASLRIILRMHIPNLSLDNTNLDIDKIELIIKRRYVAQISYAYQKKISNFFEEWGGNYCANTSFAKEMQSTWACLIRSYFMHESTRNGIDMALLSRAANVIIKTLNKNNVILNTGNHQKNKTEQLNSTMCKMIAVADHLISQNQTNYLNNEWSRLKKSYKDENFYLQIVKNNIYWNIRQRIEQIKLLPIREGVTSKTILLNDIIAMLVTQVSLNSKDFFQKIYYMANEEISAAISADISRKQCENNWVQFLTSFNP